MARKEQMVWVMDPHSGGRPIPANLKKETERRLRDHAAAKYEGRYQELHIRFHGVFCYVAAKLPGDEFPTNLCRLRHFDRDRWSLAFFAYSSEKYEPTFFPNGTFTGTPEEGLDVGAVYLQ